MLLFVMRFGSASILIFVVFFLFAGTVISVNAQEFTPEPYQPEEFPAWALDLRRGSVVAFGSFPITLLFSRVVYDVGRFSVKSIEEGQLSYAYAPLFFAPADGVPMSDADKLRIVGLGAVSAIVVAIVDYALGKIQEDSVQNDY